MSILLFTSEADPILLKASPFQKVFSDYSMPKALCVVWTSQGSAVPSFPEHTEHALVPLSGSLDIHAEFSVTE